MIRAVAFALVAIAAATPAFADEAAVKSLTYVRWVDIGPGRTVAQLKTAEVAELRRCKTWTMYFIPSGRGVEQVFVAGLTMGTSFPTMIVSRLGGETIFILSKKGEAKTSDTLHLSKDGLVLTQFSPPFRPHTYLRCVDAPKKKA